MRIRQVVKLSFLFLLLLGDYSCKQGRNPDWITVGEEFMPYISAYSGGLVSVAAPITIKLTQAAIIPVIPGELVENTLFHFEPEISGKMKWTDIETVQFVPEKYLPAGQAFVTTFDLGKVSNTPKQLEQLKFNFKTIRQSATYTLNFPKPVAEGEELAMVVDVETADVIDAEQLSTCFEAKQSGKKLGIAWETTKASKKHHFSVKGIQRGSVDTQVNVTYSGEAIDIDETEQKTMLVPATGAFRIVDMMARMLPEPEMIIRFSENLEELQVLNGLVKLLGTDMPDAAIDGNLLHIYVPENLTSSCTVELFPGIKSRKGELLQEGQTYMASFNQDRPSLNFIGDGTFLPQTKGMSILFQASHLKKVDVQVIRILEKNIPSFLSTNSLDGSNGIKQSGKIVAIKTIPLESRSIASRGNNLTYQLNLDELVSPEPGAIYRVKITYKKAYVDLPCLEQGSDLEVPEKSSDLKALNQVGFYGYSDYGDDSYNYDYDYYEDYDWSERENPCNPAFYRYTDAISKNILSTSLGLSAREAADGSWHFWCNDLIEASPLNGVSLEVLDYQNQTIASLQTNSDGYAVIKESPDDEPFLLIASKGKQKSYLRLIRSEMLSTSSFDVWGETIEDGMKAFLYGERGVWRPGDTIFLSAITHLEKTVAKDELLPPLILQVINPRGQRIAKEIKPYDPTKRLYSFAIPTSASAPTGIYTAQLQIGSSSFSKSLKVETIQPNRLKIKLDIPGDQIRKSLSNVPLNLNATWLHGSPAANLRAQVALTLRSDETSFKGYDGYIFEDPSRSNSEEEITLYDAALNENGHADVYPLYNPSQALPGKLRADFTVRVFEAGGQFSIDRFSIPWLPYEVFAGVKAPNGSGYGGALRCRQDYEIALATVNDGGKPAANRNLRVEVYKLDTQWWWQRNRNSVNDYYRSGITQAVFEREVKTNASGRGVLPIRFKTGDDGLYFVRVCDLAGGHCSGTLMSVSDNDHIEAVSAPVRNSRELELSSDKSDYATGESITLTFPSTEGGKALVTIEDGRSILHSQWMNTEAGASSLTLKALDGYSPNVYAHVTLFQPHVRNNDLPARMYGYLRLNVSDPATRLEPLIACAEVFRPEGNAKVDVSEKNGKAMEYTLALVDEGLLDITRYKTPDPWTAMNTTEALGVNCWDMYDDIIGRFSGMIESEIRIGGDMESKAGKDDNARANRFRPMVRFLGPFKLKKGGKASHQISIPAYYGSVRIMVVATSDLGAWGSSEKTVAVKKPLMILSTLPRVVSPGEEIQLPVNVFALDKSVRDVQLSIEVNSNLSVVGGAKKSVRFKANGDQLANFSLKVPNRTGIAKVTIRASSGKETAISVTELDIRSPNPLLTRSESILLQAGESISKEINVEGMPGTCSASLEFSGMPAINLVNRLGYLTSYPHGCLEQTTSTAFPQLYLAKLADVSELDLTRGKKYVQEGIRKLSNMQISSGGFVYWPSSRTADDWSTSYAGHFLVEARLAGYAVSSDVLSNWKKYQKSSAKAWNPPSKEYYDDGLLQAYRLFTLALSGSSETGPMNRLREYPRLSRESALMLAAAYAAAGQKEVATAMYSRSYSLSASSNYRYSYGDAGRDLAMRLWVTCRLGNRKAAFDLAREVAQRMGSEQWMSTQTTAWSMLALSEFYKNRDAQRIDASITQAGKTERIFTNKPFVNKPVRLESAKKTVVTINNPNKSELFLRIQTSGIPGTDKLLPAYNSGLNMLVRFQSLDGKEINPKSIAQGTDVKVELLISNPKDGKLRDDLALETMVASGWEIQNDRVNDMETLDQNDSFTYQDIRDDRLLTYFSLNPGGSKTFSFRFNAAYLGRFYLPSWVCESMYDHTVSSSSASMWVEVVNPKASATASK